jgi:putative transposase
MHERTTSHPNSAKGQKVYPSAEAPDSQGMGAIWKRCRGSGEVSDPSSDPLPMEESSGAGCASVSEWEEAQIGSPHQEAGEREPETEGSPGSADPRADAFKKRDELALTNRPTGATYSQEQRHRILEEVQRLRAQGFSISETLRGLGVCRSTYYVWLNPPTVRKKSAAVLRLTAEEQHAIIKKKKGEPQLSHRQVSGLLRQDGHWISPSSCYRRLKALGWVMAACLRTAPWKVARYEPFRPNQIWGEDWTILSITGLRHYLLTIIDYFSRYIVAWAVVKTVTQREVQALLALAYMSERIEHQHPKPIVRVDQGSPNTAIKTRRLIKDLEMLLSPARAYRPTDNARQERWYRTVKQEEIYCYPTYLSEEIARLCLAHYIDYYNEQRPHQALWNYTPGDVHRLGNKSQLLNHYRQMVQIAKERRRLVNQKGIQQQLTGVPI